jgi:hypothetical protein
MRIRREAASGACLASNGLASSACSGPLKVRHLHDACGGPLKARSRFAPIKRFQLAFAGTVCKPG